MRRLTARGRVGAAAWWWALRGLTCVTDAIPPYWRFGRWNGMLRVLAPREALATVPRRGPDAAADAPGPAPVSGPRCVLVAGELDNGGVEAVVATLAQGLAANGIRAEVVCTRLGRIGRDLTDAGIPVHVVPTAELARFLAAHDPDVVQLHRVDRALLDALDAYASRTVLVFHAMESYLDAATWSRLEAFAVHAAGAVAVSDAVRGFFLARVPTLRIEVVVNGIPVPASAPSRAAARAQVRADTGIALADDDVVVVGLQRYSDQKNAAGLVDAFLLACETEPRLRLLLAGAPDSWLEFRRADAVRRGHSHSERVHLLGDSDPRVLLAAGTVFALDSFAEGGPISAVEAVAAGLPVVVSDVGFTRRLVADPRLGRVVERANGRMTQRAIRAQRRRAHQANRAAFARALADVARDGASPHGLPLAEEFTRAHMVRAHAAVLRAAARPPHA